MVAGSVDVTPEPALQIVSMSKTFDATRALIDMALTIAPGEIRFLVGQNGCGKSTLIKVLAGFHLPDTGADVRVAGRPVSLGNAREVQDAGLRFVHQDLGLIDELSAVENIAMVGGFGARGLRPIDWRRLTKDCSEIVTGLGYDFDVRRKISELTMSERTAVAVARTVSGGAAPTVLVLDEPTANLPAGESQRLFQLVRRLAAKGTAVLFVSHHLEEIAELADSVTVMRDGRHVATRPAAAVTHEEIVELMIGRRLDTTHANAELTDTSVEPALRVSGLMSDTVQHLDLEVRPGEVVGIAGITGSGREHVGPAIFGAVARDGVVEVFGDPVPAHRPGRSLQLGLGMVPADRHASATFPGWRLRENVSILQVGRVSRWGILRRQQELSDVKGWLDRLGVRPDSDTERPIETLSGGNQQKVVLARWLRMGPRVLILDSPTQGVDVGSKSDIHQHIRDAAATGTATLVVSTDHEELAELCSRVLVMRRGVVATELLGERLSPEMITAATLSTGSSVSDSVTAPVS